MVYVYSLLAREYSSNQPRAPAVVVLGRSCPKFRISAEVSIFCRRQRKIRHEHKLPGYMLAIVFTPEKPSPEHDPAELLTN